MKDTFELFRNNNITEKYTMSAVDLIAAFKSWLENKPDEWLKEYYDLNQVAPFFIGDRQGLRSTCDLNDVPLITQLFANTYKQSHERLKAKNAAGELTEIPGQNIESNARILLYLDEAGIGSDISSIRSLVFNISMPFSEEELKDFKVERENHFKKFLREQRFGKSPGL